MRDGGTARSYLRAAPTERHTTPAMSFFSCIDARGLIIKRERRTAEIARAKLFFNLVRVVEGTKNTTGVPLSFLYFIFVSTAPARTRVDGHNTVPSFVCDRKFIMRVVRTNNVCNARIKKYTLFYEYYPKS